METDWWYYFTHSTNYTNIVLKTSNAEAIFRIYCHNLNTNIPIYYKWNLWSRDQETKSLTDSTQMYRLVYTIKIFV